MSGRRRSPFERETNDSPICTHPEAALARAQAQHGYVEAPDTLIVRRRRQRDALVLSLYGELDLASAATLQQTLALAVSNHPPGRIVVDLSGVRFMDCSGLRTLVQASRASRDRGGRLELWQASRQIRRLLELTGVTDLFRGSG